METAIQGLGFSLDLQSDSPREAPQSLGLAKRNHPVRGARGAPLFIPAMLPTLTSKNAPSSPFHGALKPNPEAERGKVQDLSVWGLGFRL